MSQSIEITEVCPCGGRYTDGTPDAYEHLLVWRATHVHHVKLPNDYGKHGTGAGDHHIGFKPDTTPMSANPWGAPTRPDVV